MCACGPSNPSSCLGLATYPKHIWAQIKSLTAQELVSALEKDGFELQDRKGAVRLYIHPDGRKITIHWHPHSTYGSGLLKALLEAVGWTTLADLKRVGLIK